MLGVGVTCPEPGDDGESETTGSDGSDDAPDKWEIACADGQACPHEIPCPPGTDLWFHYELVDGDWQHVGSSCWGDPPPEVPPTPTPGMVLTAFQTIGIPTYRSVSQPAGKTLVNFDTIFHATAEPFTATVTLLGQRVDLRIKPSSYRWEFGDGTSKTTSSGGAAYPSKEIVHRYAKAHTTISHRVVITWSATFRVNGGPWATVPGTVTRTGPSTDLRISEATPVLSGEGHRG